MLVYNQMRKPLYSVKRIGAPVPTVPELYQIHSIIWTLFYCFRKIVYHIQWIQKPGIIQTLSFVVLTFLNSIWQRKDFKKCSFFVLTSLSTHYNAHQKYVRSPWNADTSIFQTHSSGPNSVRFRGAPCMCKCNYTVVLGVQKNNVLFFCGYFIVVV